MHAFFDASEFTPTQWDTEQDKAEFANRLLDFMLTGFVAGRFTNKLYKRLSSCFGHIAHYVKTAVMRSIARHLWRFLLRLGDGLPQRRYRGLACG